MLYLILLIALKYIVNECSIIETFEYIFLAATINTVVTLPYLSYVKKEYIFDIGDKDAGLECG